VHGSLVSQAESGAETKKEDRPKSPSLLTKLLASLKGDKTEKAKTEKKGRAPKSPKKEKKKEEVEVNF